MIHKPGCWVHVDPRLSHTDIDVYPDVVPVPSDETETHIRVRRLVEIKSYRGYFRPSTCVEQVKAMLGISSPWIITPKQLYRSLKNG